MGVYGEAVITLITVQNTKGIARVKVLAPDLVAEQIHAVIADIPPKAIKTGALGNREVVEAVALAAESFTVPLIVDPVMIGSHGQPLLDAVAREALAAKLAPKAFLLMPNLAEAAELAGFPVENIESMKRAAAKLIGLGAKNVLVKGGHLQGDAVDVLLTGSAQWREFSVPRIESQHTHGTGCTYSAAIVAGLARGLDLVAAIGLAKKFVTAAIRHAPGLGAGTGPLSHFAH
jgi:hydroxymethylpyrimidine/phosphomethylpyrimidine kinase